MAPGPAMSGMAKRKRRDVFHMVNAHRRIRRGLQPLAAAVKHHFRRRREQQQAARDAKGRKRNAQKLQQFCPAKPRRHQDAKGDDGTPQCNFAPVLRRQVVCQTQEYGAEKYGIGNNKQGHQGRGEIINHRSRLTRRRAQEPERLAS